MLTFLECLYHMLLMLIASELIISSSVLLSRMKSVLRFLNIVRIPGRENFSKFGDFQMKIVSNIK